MISVNKHLFERSLRSIGYSLILGLLAFAGWQTTTSVTARPDSSRALLANEILLSAQFSPSTVNTGGVTTLSFTLTSSSTVPHPGVAFTNTLPANLTLADTASPSTDCNGTLSAPDGGSQIVFSNGRLGIGQSCSIFVNVTSDTADVYTNTTDDIESALGTYSNAAASLTVVADRPEFSLTFAPTRIYPNGISRLTYSIDNSAVGSNVFNGAFSHQLPTGLEIADPANATTDCIGTFNPEAGSTSISLFGGFFPANSTCEAAVDVIATEPGIYETSTFSFSSLPGESGMAGGTLDARTQPFVKTFVDDPAGPGEGVTLEYTISHFDRSDSLTNIAFSDDLDSALAGLVATGLPISDVCGSGSTLSGTSTISLSGGTLPAEGSCTFQVVLNVPANAAPNDYGSTSSSLTAQQDGSPMTADPAEDTLVITPLPLISKRFITPTAQSGDEVAVQFTITNTSSSNAASSVSFSDNLTDFIVGTTAPTLPTDPCGGGSSVTYGALDTDIFGLSLANGSLTANGSCTFTVTLQLPAQVAQGVYTNTVSNLSAVVDTVTYSGKSGSDSLAIIAPPTFHALFVPGSARPGDSVELVYTIGHAGSDDALPANAATSITFSHDLDAALSGLAAVGLPVSDPCGSGSTLSGTSLVTLSGGTLQPGETCTITVTVDVPDAAAVGTVTAATSNLTAQIDGKPISGVGASPELDISTVSVSKQFQPASAIPGQQVTLEYTITNHSATRNVSAMSFTDNLNSVIGSMASTSGTLNDICGSGSSLSGTTFLSFSDGNLAPNSSCTFSVSMTVPGGATEGDHISTSDFLSLSVDGSPATMDPVNAILNVNSSRLFLEKKFAGESNLPGVSSSLVYTLTNLDSDNLIDNITFSDDLDSVLTGLTATGLPVSDSCGSGSTVSGDSVITLSNGSIPAGGSCTFSIDVTVPPSAEAGNYLSTSSTVSGEISSLAVDGPAASGNLEVSQLGFSYAFAEAAAPNTTVTLTFSLSNTVDVATFENLTFSTDLGQMLPGLEAINLPATDVCGFGSTLSGSSILTLTDGSLRQLGSCEFEVQLKLPKHVPLDSYTNTIDGVTRSAALISQPISATLNIVRPEVSQSSIMLSGSSLMPGQPISYTLSATNEGTGTATDVAFVDFAPSSVDVNAIVTSTLPFTQTVNNGLTTIETAQLPPSDTTTVVIDGVISALLNSDQTIVHTINLTSTADVSSTNNAQTISFNVSVPRAEIAAESVTISVTEETGSVPISVTLDSPNPYAPVVLTYETQNGTATDGLDFTGSTAGSVTIPAGSSVASFAIPILDDVYAESTETFTVTLTASAGGQLAGTQTAVITITDSDTQVFNPNRYEAFLPSISRDTVLEGPDLIVQSATVNGSDVMIVVQNSGTEPVVNGFWVDLIVDPATPPTQPNDTAGSLGAFGIVWGVDGPDLPLAPGASIALTVDGAYYMADLSTLTEPIPAGTPIYIHVDSANSETSYGSVQERHEIAGTTYNNILMINTAGRVQILSAGRSSSRSTNTTNLPIRPNEVR